MRFNDDSQCPYISSRRNLPRHMATLDHLILLVPDCTPEQIQSYVVPFKEAGFIVFNGGTHADKKTHNMLISLPDGVYIEIIAFFDTSSHSDHWWGNKQPGWIDYCLLGTTDSSAYDPPKEGGRDDIKWKVTFPSSKYGRGNIPFYCDDITPREKRVPKPEAHPNTVVGVAEVVVNMSAERFQELEPIFENTIGKSSDRVYDLKTPNGQARLRIVVSDDTQGIQKVILKSKKPVDEKVVKLLAPFAQIAFE